MSEREQSPEGSSHGEMSERLEHHFGLIELLDDPDRNRMRERLVELWENPGQYADEGFGEPEDTLMYALRLGVNFGIEYERAYPTGRRDEWPIPKDDR